MRLVLSVALVFGGTAWTQILPAPVVVPRPLAPLSHVEQYLELTDGQLQNILANNEAYNQLARLRQMRIAQVQTEIAAGTAKETLDPMALGARYVEIEMTCRDLNKEAARFQQRNVAALTDVQRVKLELLEETVKKLLPAIDDARSANLIGSPAYAPLFFTSPSALVSTSGGVIGGVIGPVNGCYPAGPTIAMRSGDFVFAPPGGTLAPGPVAGGIILAPGNPPPSR